MEFRTTFPLPQAAIKIKHGDKIISMGSCFSFNIGQKLSYFGWEVLNNPFGTIFHPLAIAHLIKKTLQQDASIRICEKNEQFHTFESHSEIKAKSKRELHQLFEQKINDFSLFLDKADWLILTFGSAWGYFLENVIVANCHKQAQHLFQKKLSTISEMEEVYFQLFQQLQKRYPHLKILISVSPVRHIKDGMIENQRSKACLIELAHRLEGIYFPAYELMMDDLRDYRFYNRDKIHPSEEAVEYIFEQFGLSTIERASLAVFPQIDQLRKENLHRSKNNQSPSFKLFQEKHQKKVQTFLIKNPKVIWF
jgi:hypothetical protein